MNFERPKAANDNLEINAQAKDLLYDTGELIQRLRVDIGKKRESLQTRLAEWHGDMPESQQLEFEVQYVRLANIEKACREAEIRRNVLLAEPDQDTLRDAQALYTDISALVAQYDSEESD